MADLATHRIQRELRDLMKTEEGQKKHIKVEVTGDNVTNLRGEIAGPPNTPYEGGKYQLEIKIPTSYPFNPPKIRFLTKIWHPNIYTTTGFICLDILKDQWVASMTLTTVLLSLQALLASPNPGQTVNVNSEQSDGIYNETARFWAHVYAGASAPVSSPEYMEKITNLCAAGFGQDEVIDALSSKLWDVEAAANLLLLID